MNYLDRVEEIGRDRNVDTETIEKAKQMATNRLENHTGWEDSTESWLAYRTLSDAVEGFDR